MGKNVVMDVEVAEIVEFLAKHAPFDGLSVAERRDVARSVRIRYFRRGSVILEKGGSNNSLFILRSGAVDIVDRNDNLVERTEPGGSFGSSTLLSKGPSRYTITAIEDSLVLVLPGPYFSRLYRDSEVVHDFYAPRQLRRAAETTQRTDSSLLRVDASAFTGRPLVTAHPGTPIREAAAIMTANRVSCLLVTGTDDSLLGILTDRDLRSRVVLGGVDTALPISEVMTTDPVVIGPEFRAFEVLLEMTTRKVHHLPIVRGGVPIGLVSAGDLMRLETSNPVYLVSDIAKKTDLGSLVTVAQRVSGLVRNLVEQGASADDAARVITMVTDSLTVRLIQLAEAELGEAPQPWCWVSVGSQARREMGLNSDQDHAMILSNNVTNDDLGWYETVAHRVTDGLEACGMARCKGEVMASNPEWRVTSDVWLRHFLGWMNEPNSGALLHSQIFYDPRSLHGTTSLLDEIRAVVLDLAPQSKRFLGNMAAMAVDRSPPLGFFKGFVLERQGVHKDQLDLKGGGLHAVIELARVHALAAGIHAVGTEDRLRAIGQSGSLSDEVIRDLIDAFRFISNIRLAHQIRQVELGQEPDNFVNPEDLTTAEKRHLREGFNIIRKAQSSLSVIYQTHLML